MAGREQNQSSLMIFLIHVYSARIADGRSDHVTKISPRLPLLSDGKSSFVFAKNTIIILPYSGMLIISFDET